VTIDKIKSDFVFYKHFSGKEVIKSDILKDGQIYIQDPATSMATSNINFHGNGNILDACSAPGGKTIMLSELYPKSQIYAMDRSERRLFRVEQNIKNAGCNNVKTIASDILDAPFEDAYFDVVFLDVPCSNSGVLRKRPDALWKLNAERINDIIRLQRKMLDSANRLVKKGGTLVYSTCSIEADENKKQIETFLKNNTNYTLEFQKQLLPDMDNDGAFVAVMNKQ
jgi:16S rRNA (cytosine967-C5)-methyltransferase